MNDAIVQFFSTFPHWIATLLMATTPVGELRLAIPVAVLGYKMSVVWAFLWAVIGNIIPVILLTIIFAPINRWLEKQTGFFGRAWANYLARVRKKFDGTYEKYGLIGLVIFVGIPLPMTGAWSGAIAAFLFGLPPFKSIAAIIVGILISASITTAITLTAGHIF